RNDDERLAVEAMLARAGVLGKGKLLEDESQRLLEWVLARSGDPQVRVRAERFRALSLIRQGRFEDAIAVFEQTIALAEQTYGEDDMIVEGLLTPMGTAL